MSRPLFAFSGHTARLPCGERAARRAGGRSGGTESMRRRRQAGADARVPDGSDARSRAPTDDPDELVIRTTPGGGRYTYVSPNVRSILGWDRLRPGLPLRLPGAGR